MQDSWPSCRELSSSGPISKQQHFTKALKWEGRRPGSKPGFAELLEYTEIFTVFLKKNTSPCINQALHFRLHLFDIIAGTYSRTFSGCLLLSRKSRCNWNNHISAPRAQGRPKLTFIKACVPVCIPHPILTVTLIRFLSVSFIFLIKRLKLR